MTFGILQNASETTPKHLKLFTLRESRRGRLEARGRGDWQVGISEASDSVIPEARNPGTVWVEMAMEWNRMEWKGMEWNGAQRNGMEWCGERNGTERHGVEWKGVEWNAMEWDGKEWQE